MLKRCDDGEVLVCVDQTLIHKQRVVVVHVLKLPVNESLMDLLIIIDTVKLAKPEHLTLVLPYYAYGRQNRPRHDCTSLSAHLMIRLLATAGLDELITVDAHHPDIFKEAPFKVRLLSAVPLFAQVIQKQNLSPVIIAPDQGASDRARTLAEHLNTDWAVLNKQRLKNGDIVIEGLDKTIENRNCIIVDDIVDSAKTVCLAADYLIKAKACQVQAFVTHGILGKNSLNRIEQSSLKNLTITNTVPLQSLRLSPKITRLDITPFLVEELAFMNNHPCA